MKQPTNEFNSLLRISAFSKLIGLSVSTLDRMQSENKLCPADYLLGKGKIRAWKYETIIKWLELQRNPKANAS